MDRKRFVAGTLALAMVVMTGAVAVAQDDDPLMLIDEEAAPVTVTTADIEALELLLDTLEADVTANSSSINDLGISLDAVVGKADNVVPRLRERITANAQANKAILAQLAVVSQRVDENRQALRDLRPILRGLTAAVERLGESPCTGPTCAD